MRLGLSFDLRNPAQWFKPWKEFSAAALDLICAAEELGIDIVKVAEHHLFADGYMPQPLTFLSAVAARTSRIRISTGVMIAPLHSAVEIAEQAAVVDCLSGGRLELAFGAGYRIPEYELYGVDFKDRFKLYEARVKEIRELWTEKRITPQPVQASIPLWAGLKGPRNSRMAGRLGMARLYWGTETWEDYLQGLDEGGYGRQSARLGGSLQGVLADDPERAFGILVPRIEHNWNTYAAYGAEGTGQPAPAPLRAEDFRKASGRVSFGFSVVSPEEAAAQIKESAAGRNVDTVYLAGAVSGVIDDFAFRNVDLMATRLKPLLNA